LRVLLESEAENLFLPEIEKLLKSLKANYKILQKKDAYVQVVWGIDDLEEMGEIFKHVDYMSEETKKDVLEYAEKYIAEAMTDKGKEVLDDRLNSYISERQKIIIGRPINGISLNPLEWVRDEDDNPIEFLSVADAKSFLKEKGYTDKEIYEGITFCDAKDCSCIE